MPGPASGINSLLDLMQPQQQGGGNPAPPAQQPMFGAPPPDQSVLDIIAQMRATGGGGTGPAKLGTGAAPFQGNEYFEAAAQPGMSGYFGVDQGRIVPRKMDPRQVAGDAGVGLGQLAAGQFPSGVPGETQYRLPNDRGGFFSMEDLYRTGNQPIPPIGTYGQNQLSTNNWRLLGRGPGWIMRNGQLINAQAPEVRKGMWVGADMGYGDTAEQGNVSRQVAVGTGVGLGVPGYYTPSAIGGWPGQATGWYRG